HAIHIHIVTAPLLLQLLRQSRNARLRGGVVNLSRVAIHTRNGGDIHHLAWVGPAKRRLLSFSRVANEVRCLAQNAERGGSMHIYHGVPLLIGHILNDSIPGIACVIDDDVYPSKGIERSLHQLSRKSRVGHITRDDRSLTARVTNSSCSFLRRSGIEIAYHYQRALRTK